jgi:putative endonuclease
MTRKQQVGQWGEQHAAAYLRDQGYSIIAQNWHCPHGELDIIAQQGDTLVFVEVRTRHSASADNALLSVTPRKQARVIASAHHYLADHAAPDTPWRVDVIAVTLPHHGPPQITHVEDAFDW